MKKQMAKLGLKFEFVDATDGRRPLAAAEIDLMGGEKMLRRYEGEDSFTGGAVGCIISHLRCYKKLLASRHTRALILEDDAAFAKDFIPMLDALLSASFRWNHIRLGHIFIPKDSPIIGKNIFSINIFSRRRINTEKPTEGKSYYWGPATVNFHGTFAYLINREGCEFALKHYPAIKPTHIDVGMMSCYPMPYQFIVSPSIVGCMDIDKGSINWMIPGNEAFVLNVARQTPASPPPPPTLQQNRDSQLALHQRQQNWKRRTLCPPT